MRTLPFSILVAACLAVLLGLRFGLEAVLPGTAEAATEVDRSEAMAVPPKPTGEPDLPAPGAPGDGDGQSVLTSAQCEGMTPSLRDTCWQALARQTAGADPEEALRVCGRIDDGEMRDECHADVAETIAIPDRARAEAICGAITDLKWRGQCFFGTGLALAETDPEYAITRCAHAEIFQTFCRHDVIGEMALVNLPAAQAICAREEGDWLTRKSCWHGMSKYIARRDVREAAQSCAGATAEWRGTCFHGLGWGGAERDPDATLSACAEFGEYADNCRHGVANELKRADPPRAVALCEAIQKADTRTRCLDFVTR